MSVTYILLAAGASSRMRGTDKLMESVRGQPLILDRLQALRPAGHGTADLIVVLRPDRPERLAALAEQKVRIVENSQADSGLGSSVKAAVTAAPLHSKAALFLPADMPDITRDDIGLLVQAHQRNPSAIIRAATQDGRPGNPVIFPSAFFKALAALSGDQGGRGIMKANAGMVELVPLAGDRAATDLDTPEDWAKWRAKNPSL